MSEVHSTAVIAESAEIGEGTSIGAYAVIGPEVKIGKNNRIATHVVIEGRTTIGDENNIFQFSSIGAMPQDLKYHGEPSSLEIGNKNIIREYVTLQPGTEGGHMLTKVGSHNLFMACAHVAHDVIMGDHNIMVNNAGLAGHITVGNHVIMGGHSGYHQFVRLGDYSIISGGAIVTKDIPPYCVAQGDRAGLAGINKVGLERNGFADEQIRLVQNLYKTIFLSDENTFSQRLELAIKEYQGDRVAENFLFFLRDSERGIVLPRKG